MLVKQLGESETRLQQGMPHPHRGRNGRRMEVKERQWARDLPDSSYDEQNNLGGYFKNERYFVELWPADLVDKADDTHFYVGVADGTQQVVGVPLAPEAQDNVVDEVFAKVKRQVGSLFPQPTAAPIICLEDVDPPPNFTVDGMLTAVPWRSWAWRNWLSEHWSMPGKRRRPNRADLPPHIASALALLRLGRLKGDLEHVQLKSPDLTELERDVKAKLKAYQQAVLALQHVASEEYQAALGAWESACDALEEGKRGAQHPPHPEAGELLLLVPREHAKMAGMPTISVPQALVQEFRHVVLHITLPGTSIPLYVRRASILTHAVLGNARSGARGDVDALSAPVTWAYLNYVRNPLLLRTTWHLTASAAVVVRRRDVVLYPGPGRGTQVFKSVKGACLNLFACHVIVVAVDSLSLNSKAERRASWGKIPLLGPLLAHMHQSVSVHVMLLATQACGVEPLLQAAAGLSQMPQHLDLQLVPWYEAAERLQELLPALPSLSERFYLHRQHWGEETPLLPLENWPVDMDLDGGFVFVNPRCVRMPSEEIHDHVERFVKQHYQLPFAAVHKVPRRAFAAALLHKLQECRDSGAWTIHVVQCFAKGGATTALRQVMVMKAKHSYVLQLTVSMFRKDKLSKAACWLAEKHRKRASNSQQLRFVVVADSGVLRAQAATRLAENLHNDIFRQTRLAATVVVVHTTRWVPIVPMPSRVDVVFPCHVVTREEKQKLADFLDGVAGAGPSVTHHLREITEMQRPVHLAEIVACATDELALLGAERIRGLNDDAKHRLGWLAAFAVCLCVQEERAWIPYGFLKTDLRSVLDMLLVRGRHGDHPQDVALSPFWALVVLRALGVDLSEPEQLLDRVVHGLGFCILNRLFDTVRMLVRGDLPFWISVFADSSGRMGKARKHLIEDRLQLVFSITRLDRQTAAPAQTRVGLHVVLSKMERRIQTALPRQHPSPRDQLCADVQSFTRAMRHAERAAKVVLDAGFSVDDVVQVGFVGASAFAYCVALLAGNLCRLVHMSEPSSSSNNGLHSKLVGLGREGCVLMRLLMGLSTNSGGILQAQERRAVRVLGLRRRDLPAVTVGGTIPGQIANGIIKCQAVAQVLTDVADLLCQGRSSEAATSAGAARHASTQGFSATPATAEANEEEEEEEDEEEEEEEEEEEWEEEEEQKKGKGEDEDDEDVEQHPKSGQDATAVAFQLRDAREAFLKLKLTPVSAPHHV